MHNPGCPHCCGLEPLSVDELYHLQSRSPSEFAPYDAVDALIWLKQHPAWAELDNLIENANSAREEEMQNALSDLHLYVLDALYAVGDGRTEYSNGLPFQREVEVQTTNANGDQVLRIIRFPQSPTGQIYPVVQEVWDGREE